MDFFAGARSERRKKGGLRKLGDGGWIGGGAEQRRLSNTLGRFWYSSEPGKEELKEFNSALISFFFLFFFLLPCTQI